MAVGVAAGTGEDTPIGIAPYVGSLPSSLAGVVESYGNILIAGLSVDDGLYWLVRPCGVYIHPVVLLRAVGDGIEGVAHALAVATVSALEHVEVYPWSLAPPPCRRVASTGVIGHEVVVVNGFDGSCQRVPYFRMDIAFYVATHYPYDVRLVLVTVRKELPVGLCLSLVDVSVLYL